LMRCGNNARTNAGRDGALTPFPALTTNLVGGRMAEIESKTCIKCGQHLPLTEFHRTPNNRDGRTGSCKPCRNAYQKAWTESLPEDHRNARRDRHNAVNREYKSKNRRKIGEYTARTRDQNTARHRAWRKANPDKWGAIIRASDGRRRACKKGGMGGPEVREWWASQKKVCHWCGKRCAKDAEMDHIVPLKLGGAHEAHNLCVACRDCNRRKSARDPIVWAQMIGKLL
jgi:5-methylcytosine-specific restriction endonuclease McrA